MPDDVWFSRTRHERFGHRIVNSVQRRFIWPYPPNGGVMATHAGW